MTRASSLSPSTSIFSSVIDNKEDNAKRGCEGLVKELELPLPETNAMVGAEGFSILGLVLMSISVDFNLLKSSSTVRVS